MDKKKYLELEQAHMTIAKDKQIEFGSSCALSDTKGCLLCEKKV